MLNIVLFICLGSNDSQSQCYERGLLCREQNFFSRAPAVRKYSKIKKNYCLVVDFPKCLSPFHKEHNSLSNSLRHVKQLKALLSACRILFVPLSCYSELVLILRQARIQRRVCTVVVFFSVSAVYQMGENCILLHAEYAQ